MDHGMMALKKCSLTISDGVEICVTHNLMNGDISLELNQMISSNVGVEIADWNRMQSILGMTEYMTQRKWIWGADGRGGNCNAKLLSVIGRTICIRNEEDSVYAEILDDVGD